jgi:hypothetical protein
MNRAIIPILGLLILGIVSAPWLHGLLMRERCESDNPNLAIEDCGAVIAADRNRLASDYHNRGNAYLRRGVYDSAIADFSEPIRLAPNAESYLARTGVFMDLRTPAVGLGADDLVCDSALYAALLC